MIRVEGSLAKAYGEFYKLDKLLFRKNTFIQFGKSENSIGCALLLNPGSSELESHITDEIDTKGYASGEIKLDATMKQLIELISLIYKGKKIEGRFHIYNLFELKNSKSTDAIEEYEQLVNRKRLDIKHSLPSIDELSQHPWIFLGWGLKDKQSYKNLHSIKKLWLDQINQASLKFFGKKLPNKNNYYHICPHVRSDRAQIITDLHQIYQDAIAFTSY